MSVGGSHRGESLCQWAEGAVRGRIEVLCWVEADLMTSHPLAPVQIEMAILHNLSYERMLESCQG